MLNERQLAWVEALESGEYRQGLKALHFNNPDTGESRHCCLGVACEVFNKLNPDNPVNVKQTPTFGSNLVTYDGEASVLPEPVRQFFNLRTVRGDIYEEDKPGALTAYNDNSYTFQQIANIIRSEPDGLFDQET